MKISEAFPSKYVSAAELQGQDVTVAMSHVVMEEVDDNEPRPVLYFQGMSKGLVLNRTNATTIADMYGDDTDGWAGRPITVFPTQTEFRGKQVACIRVRINKPVVQAAQPMSTPPTPPQAPPQQVGVRF